MNKSHLPHRFPSLQQWGDLVGELSMRSWGTVWRAVSTWHSGRDRWFHPSLHPAVQHLLFSNLFSFSILHYYYFLKHTSQSVDHFQACSTSTLTVAYHQLKPVLYLQCLDIWIEWAATSPVAHMSKWTASCQLHCLRKSQPIYLLALVSSDTSSPSLHQFVRESRGSTPSSTALSDSLFYLRDLSFL